MVDASPSPPFAPDRIGPLASAGNAASSVALMGFNRRLAKPDSGPTAPDRQAVKALKAAVASIRSQDYPAASRQALKALETAERWSVAWHVLAIACEKAGDVIQAITAYETALKLSDDHAAIAGDLGRLAQRLGYGEIAEKLLKRALEMTPGNAEAANNLACVMRDQQRYAEAIAFLTELINGSPDNPLYWNTLGTVLTDQGEMSKSLPFFEEALRLQPEDHKAMYNRANARMALGHAREALADIDAALPLCTDAFETATMKMARALTQLLLGELEEGFETYEVRFDPRLTDALTFATSAKPWSPDIDPKGRRLLVFGEQGLGDEVLFASVLPDLIKEAGAEGEVTIAVEHRLTPLFARSFPEANVVRHQTVRHGGRLARAALDAGDAEVAAPMGSLFRRYRRTASDFPRRAFLKASPPEIARWQAMLGALGPQPKVGIVWKSLRLDGHRARYFSPFDLWRGILRTPGVTFVNLQYGDCAAEMAQAAAEGLSVWTPDLDLKDDLDGVAALTCALDLIIGPANATTNIAAACGAPVWVVSTPDHWPSFGAATWPSYPDATLYPADGFAQWEGVMDRISKDLASRYGSSQPSQP